MERMKSLDQSKVAVIAGILAVILFVAVNVLVGTGASGLALPTWSRFLARLFARVGPAIDLIALDHYPDTWALGGSRSWDCVAEARRRGCAQFHLDSGVQRFDAHRFYLHKGMNISAHHFAMPL